MTPAPPGAPSTRSSGRDLSLAAPLAAASALSALAAAVLVTRADAWADAATVDLPVDATLGVIYPVVGAAVLGAGRGARRVGWLLVLVGVAGAAAALGMAVAATEPAGSAAAGVAAAVEGWVWVPAFIPLVTLLPLIYPTGRLVGPRWRAAAIAAIGGIVSMSLGAALLPEGETPGLGTATALFLAGSVLVVPSALAGLASLLVRLRRSSGLQHRQVTVFLGAASLLLLDIALQPALSSPVDVLSQAVAVALLPVAIGVAVTRLRLYELDAAVRRGMVAVSLAVSLAAGYALLYAVVAELLGGATPVAAVSAAAATGLLVYPLVTRLDAGAARLLTGGRVDPHAVLTAIAHQTRDESDPRLLPSLLCATLLREARLGRVELHVGGRPVASAGESPRATVELALRHGGEQVGRLVLAPLQAEPDLDTHDLELLRAIAQQVAPAVSAIRLFDEVSRSREALVVAREEERRRIRHDLHDGVGAALAGVRLQVDAALDRVAADAVSAQLLESASRGLSDAVSDVRRLTDDLRPAALDELGLPGSLSALAERWARPDLSVRLSVGDLPALPAASEVACYRIVGEALANAARHSGASEVRVDVGTESGRLRIEVSDDGRGIGAPEPGERGRGLGLGSMRTRTEEIGGRFSVSSSGDGTSVRAVLPA